MHASMIKQLQLANNLRRATDRGELTLHFQVMHSLASNEIYGFEALVRWNHPVYGLLLPNEFIPLAEENGLINQIDNWVLAEACRQMREWQKLNPLYNNLIVSVNVSAKQFNQ